MAIITAFNSRVFSIASATYKVEYPYKKTAVSLVAIYIYIYIYIYTRM